MATLALLHCLAKESLPGGEARMCLLPTKSSFSLLIKVVPRMLMARKGRRITGLDQ